jgi:hypothetical protein
MNRHELEELHYITPIENVRSILEHGILSHQLAEAIAHRSVAMSEIQDKRSKVVVPGGRPLHQYVNLYFCARNPMMSKRRAEHERICVLRVRMEVIDLPGVVITDQNAASTYARFGAAPAALSRVDRDLVFAEFWKHPDDQIMEWRHASIKCAETLVPDKIEPEYVFGAYVSCEASQAAIMAIAPRLAVVVNPHLFFR